MIPVTNTSHQADTYKAEANQKEWLVASKFTLTNNHKPAGHALLLYVFKFNQKEVNLLFYLRPMSI